MADVIIANKSKDINQDEELLSNTTAYLGQGIIRECGGEWGWENIMDRVEIIKMNCMLAVQGVQGGIQHFRNESNKENFVGTYK